MLRDITLKNFRTFDHFAFDGFTHVNLIVGKNNSGKTGLLEAVYLLLNQGSPYYLVESLRLRGEGVSTDFLSDDDQRRFRTRRSFSIAHLFYGHTPLAFARDWNQSNMFDDVDYASRVRATAIAISSKEDRAQTLSIRLAEKPPNHTDMSERLNPSERVEATYDLVISYSGTSVDDHVAAREYTVPVFADLSIYDGYARGPGRVAPHLLIPTDRTSNSRLAEYWNAITLTPREDKVVQALQILEPSVDRISFTSQLTAPPDILIKLKGQSVPLPLGTMGDGMRRILALVAAAVVAEGGSLCIDEIDTGLYYRAQVDMWRLLLDLSKRIGVQIFATTHSLDCVQAFEIALALGGDDSRGKLLRLERYKGGIRAVDYSAEELSIASRESIEVR